MLKHGLNITADLYSEKAFVKVFPSSGNFFQLINLLLIFAVSLLLYLYLSRCRRRTKPYKPKKCKPAAENKQTRIYESVPVQLPANMVPVGPAQGDYLVYTRPCTPDPLYHAVIRTPSHHNYETPVFRFPDVPQRSRGNSIQRSRAGSAQVKCTIERDDNMDSVSV